ncbi:hypothetical protein BSLG_000246 [Batrachochytrium salamandrivorans]|nr:hypothetical protein BSLG_000246 [Batrachochytrium salamandrivorans]
MLTSTNTMRAIAIAAFAFLAITISVGADLNKLPPPEIPLLTVFDQVEKGFDESGAYALYWSIEHITTPNETLHAALVFNATKYFSFNIDDGPERSSESLLIRVHPTTGVVIPFESIPSGYYSSPINSPNKVISLNGMIQEIFGQTMVVEFRRPTKLPKSIYHASIDITAPQHHIFAFNPHPNPGSEGGWRDHHGKHRGAYQIVYSSGMASSIDPDSIYVKRIHGIAMVITWMFLFPSSIFFTRYFRSVTPWMRVHIFINSTGAIFGAFASTIYVINSLSNNTRNPHTSLIFRPHSILGLCLIAGVFMQGVLGIANRYYLKTDSFSVDRSRFCIVRFVHNWLGRVLVLVAFFQIGLGLQIIYPFRDIQFHGFAAWTVYFIVISFWTILFVGTEVYYQYVLVNTSKRIVIDQHGKRRVIGAGNDVVAYSSLPSAGGRANTINQLNKESLTLSTDLKPYTWDEINHNVQLGNLLVVANCRYVYCIDSWINSHPGGQLILHSVAGTDITNDYFSEAGYDADAFVPSPAVKVRSLSGPNVRQLPRNDTERYAESIMYLRTQESLSTLQNYFGTDQIPLYPPSSRSSIASQRHMVDEEWQYIVRARRTHVHTRLAIKKLSTLIVGRLVTSSGSDSRVSSNSSLLSPTEVLFEPTEYRRYALVSSVLETPQGTVTPIYRLKLCLLYPYDVRSGEPKHFFPGQSIELQARVNGNFISRFYTPIKGNPTCFEIFVKMYPSGGIVSPFLSRQKLGERQLKVRGPFGVPVVHPGNTSILDSGTKTTPTVFYDRLVLIGGGSGLVASIQFIQTLLLPTLTPISVWQAYESTDPDELTLRVGDWVMARHHYLDGWAEGVNLTTQQEGLFPLPVTVPCPGSALRISIINATQSPFEIFANDIISGAMLAYPQHIQITHCFSRGGVSDGQTMDNIPGEAVQGRISPYVINQALQFVQWKPRPHGSSQRLVICGSKSFQGDIYDMACSSCGVEYNDVVILSDDIRA